MICVKEPDSIFCRVAKRVDNDMDIPHMDLVYLVRSAVDNDGVISDDLRVKYPYLKHEIDYLEEVTIFESVKWFLEIAEEDELPIETMEKLKKYWLRMQNFQLKYKRLHDPDELAETIEDLELLLVVYRALGSNKKLN